MTTTTKIPPRRHRLLPAEEPIEHEPRVVRWFPWIIIALGLLAIAAAIVLTRQVGESTDKAVVAEAAATSLADQITAECTAGRLDGAICAEAEQVDQVVALPAPGINGVDGRPGVDGQSPPCLDTPTMCQGQDGEPGVDGQDGADGQSPPCLDTPSMCQGADGNPAETLIERNSDGSSRTCQRDPDTPDTAPTYTCVTSPAPSEAP